MALARKTRDEEPTARQRVVLGTDARLSDVLDSMGLPYELIPGHASVYSKLGFHETCDKLIANQWRQIYGSPFEAHYELGKIIKVRKDTVMAKDGHGVKYVERVTIS